MPVNKINIALTGYHVRYKDGKPYKGEYEVTPATYEVQTLPTKDCILDKNITVNKIPQYEVSNSAEGITLIIGEESLNA